MDNKEEEKIINNASEETKDNPVVPEEKKEVELPKPIIEEEKPSEIKVDLPPSTEDVYKDEPKEEKKEEPTEEPKAEEPTEEPAPVEEPTEEAAPVEETPAEEPAPVVPEIPSKEEVKEEVPVNTEIINQQFDAGEQKEDVKIEGNKLESADFSKMFNVASEETPEQKGVTPVEAPAAPVAETPEVKEEAKQHKKSYFNSEEKTLYTIEEEKESNPIMAGIFILIFVAFILFLPVITGTSEKALEKIYGKVRVNTKQEEEIPASKYYYIGDTSKLDVDDLTITNVVKAKKGKNEYIMTFTLTNLGSRAYQYDKNYYIILMNENQPVFHIKLFSYDAVAPNGATELTFIINEKTYEQANRFRVDLLEKSDYPDITLNVEDGDYKVLTCKYLTDEMKYYFIDNKLSKIRETYTETYSDDNIDYNQHKEEYKKLSAKYNAIDNFNSVFVDRNATDTTVPKTFEMINDLNLSQIPSKTLSNLRTYKFFSYNEDKNVVSYEAESLGYSCG